MFEAEKILNEYLLDEWIETRKLGMPRMESKLCAREDAKYGDGIDIGLGMTLEPFPSQVSEKWGRGGCICICVHF